jgi:hypothetical protein
VNVSRASKLQGQDTEAYSGCYDTWENALVALYEKYSPYEVAEKWVQLEIESALRNLKLAGRAV